MMNQPGFFCQSKEKKQQVLEKGYSNKVSYY